MISIKIKIRVHTLVLGQVFFFARFKLQQWFRCWEQILVVVAERVVERCLFLHLICSHHKNKRKKHTTFWKVFSSHCTWYLLIEIWTFYSAPSIFAVCRNLVREIWFEKSGSRKVVDRNLILVSVADTETRFRSYTNKSTFFLVREKWLTRKKIWVSRTTFLEPFFYKWLQNKWSNAIPNWIWPHCELLLRFSIRFFTM